MKRLFLLLSFFVFSFSNAQTGLLNGTGYAPNFTVTDLNGNSHTIYDYLDSGYVMVLELLSVYCGHCQSHAAGTENSYLTNGPSGTNIARFLGLEVSPATDSVAVANFISTYGVTFPMANNVSPTAINYQLYYTPGYYVIYPDYTYTTICGAYCVTAQNYSTIEGLLNTAISFWSPPVYGCMDSLALNYDSLATVDNDSCDYSSYTIKTIGMSFSPDTIVCDVGDTINFILGPNHNAVEVNDTTWLTGGTASNGGFSFGFGATGMFIPDDCHTFYYVCQPHSANGMKGVIVAHHPPVFGCTDSLAINYDSLANHDDGSCMYDGCTDATACNYDALATIDDGSCEFISCATTCSGADPVTGVFVDAIIHNRATFNWDNMNSSTCSVDQMVFRYREVGTSGWTNKFLGNPVGSTIYYGTSKTVLGLSASTTYEYQFKIWYVGVSSPVNWGANPSGTFTTLAACPNVGNLTVTTPLTTRATFTWDDSNGPYSFARIKMRVDSISSPSASDWQNVGGFGVVYPTFTRNKNGLTPGETYRGQAKTWCDPAGGPYKSASWTPLLFWTQPTSVRIEGGSSIANLDVYPNPSRDVFSVTFTSETIQDLRVRVYNVVGEEIVFDDLQQFVGEYTKQIDLGDYAKGIYFLEIETNKEVINKKLILQ